MDICPNVAVPPDPTTILLANSLYEVVKDVPVAAPRIGVIRVGVFERTTPPVPVDADVEPVPLRALAMSICPQGKSPHGVYDFGDYST
jgi:hypothetical protein